MTHQDQQQDFTRSMAVSWYWRLQDADMPPEERQQFRAWIAIDEHRKAFDRAATVWEDTCQAVLADGADAAAPPSAHRRLTRVLARAAIGLFMLVAFGSQPGTPRWILETDNTITARLLIDGSFTRIAPDTHLEIWFDERERSSYLSRGQAFFQVSKDTTRPFIVRTPAAIVHATGTRFGITYQQKTSVITVTEGSVIVTPSNTPPPGVPETAAQCWLLEAGQRLRVSPTGANFDLHVEADGSLDWATTITFERDPPGVAVARFNRLSDVRLELLNPSVAGALITGTYQLDDPAAFANKLANETSSPVRVYERTAGGRKAIPEIVPPDRNRETVP